MDARYLPKVPSHRLFVIFENLNLCYATGNPHCRKERAVTNAGKPLLILAVLLILLFQVPSLFAAERSVPAGPVTIEADRLEYDERTQTYLAEGRVLITFEDGLLRGDRVLMNRETGDVEARGHVFLRSGLDTMEGERLDFNIDSRQGSLDRGTLFIEQNNFYLTAEEIRKTGDASYSLRDARATTCDGPEPDWRFTGKEVDVTIDGYGTIRDGTFQVRNVPLLYVPYLLFPAKTTRQTGFLFPRFAYSQDKLGWDVEVPFYWVLSDSADATFYERYMDKRGMQFGTEFRYCLSEDSAGTVYGDYLNDAMDVSGEDDGLDRDWEGNHKRWSWYVNHESRFDHGISFRADLRKISDIWYFRDFDSYNYYSAHYGGNSGGPFDGVSFLGDRSLASLDSTARLVKDGPLYNATALVQYTDDLQRISNENTLQKYPEVTFSLIQQPLFGTPFTVESETQYDYYYRRTGYRGHFLDEYPTVSLPLRYRHYLEFTPEMAARFTAWDSQDTLTPEQSTHASRALYEAGGTLSTEVQRIFNIGGEHLDKLRHLIKPEVAYLYIPYKNQEDMPDFVPVIDETNALTYSVTNFITARLKDEKGNISYREVMRLKLSQTYDIREARRTLESPDDDRRPFGNLDMELDVNPFQYLSFSSDARFDTESGEWKRLNASLDTTDPRGDSAGIEYRYTQNSVEEVNLSLAGVVTESLTLSYILKKNLLDHRYIETAYGIDYHKQCWSVNFSYTDSSDDRGFMVIFTLLGLGKVGKVSGSVPEEW